MSARSRHGWSIRLDDPIILDDGTTLSTLCDAIQHLAKTVPKADRDHEKVLVAADHLTRSAEQGYPLFFARATTLQASIATRSAFASPKH